MKYGSRSRVPADSGSAHLATQLADLLARLRSWEDPRNSSGTAVVYREMCAQAERART